MMTNEFNSSHISVYVSLDILSRIDVNLLDEKSGIDVNLKLTTWQV